MSKSGNEMTGRFKQQESVCEFLATSVNIKRIILKPPSGVASLSQMCVLVHV